MTQRGPSCLPACGAMALSLEDPSVTAKELTREVAMYPDGTGFFDLQEALKRRGVEALVWQGNATQAACLVEHGIPVIAAVKQGGAKHAVLVSGARWSESGFTCGQAPRAIQIMDPRSGKARWLDPDGLDRWLFARQLMAVPPRKGGLLKRARQGGFPLLAVQQANGRFRSSGWLRRASRHERPNPQMLTLLERAVQEDPCWPEARGALSRASKSLGVAPKASLPSCAEARSMTSGEKLD